jgi:hypothetical protein
MEMGFRTLAPRPPLPPHALCIARSAELVSRPTTTCTRLRGKATFCIIECENRTEQNPIYRTTYLRDPPGLGSSGFSSSTVVRQFLTHSAKYAHCDLRRETEKQ